MPCRVGAGRAGVQRFTVIFQEWQPAKVSRPRPRHAGRVGLPQGLHGACPGDWEPLGWSRGASTLLTMQEN